MLAWRDGRERAAVAYQRNWGPVRSREAAAAGCVRCATSVVITPDIPPAVVAHALQCVPDEVLPRADDSAEGLAARLGASLFLDDAHVLNGGNGKRGKHGKRRRLNESCYAAPRRKSWSAVVKAERLDSEGDRVVVYDYKKKLSTLGIVKQVLGSNTYSVECGHGPLHVSGDALSRSRLDVEDFSEPKLTAQVSDDSQLVQDIGQDSDDSVDDSSSDDEDYGHSLVPAVVPHRRRRVRQPELGPICPTRLRQRH